MVKIKLSLVMVSLSVIFIFFHALRDFLQLIGIHNFISDFYHSQGIEDTNKILGLIGLQYKRWTEIPMILAEIFLLKKLIKYKEKIKTTFSQC